MQRYNSYDGETVVPPDQSAIRNRQSAILLVALGSTLWGTDTALRRLLAQALSTPVVVLYEHVALGLVLLPAAIGGHREWRRLGIADWGALLWIAWGGSALATLCFTRAIQLGNPNTVVLLQKIQPVFVALLAAALLGERLRRGYWLLLALAILGASIVAFGANASPQGSGATWWGLPRLSAVIGPGRYGAPVGVYPFSSAALTLVAAVFWAGSTVAGRRMTTRVSFLTLTALRILLALPVLLLVSLLRTEPLPTPTIRQLTGLAWLSLVPGLAALLLYYRGLRHTPASRAAIAELCFPATAVLLNWLLLDAGISLLQLAGFLLLWAVIFRMTVDKPQTAEHVKAPRDRI